MSNSRSSLIATAQREIDALRAELDVRLAALERALAHPDPATSLERLIIDLARVATAEAEASAVRATLEAQVHAQEEAGVAVAQARTALEAERSAAAALRAERDARAADAAALQAELGTHKKDIRALQAALGTRNNDVAALQAEVDAHQQDVVALRSAVETRDAAVVRLQTDFESERANAQRLQADLERTRGELAGLREALEGERESTAQLRRQVDLEQGELQAAIDADAAHRRRIDDLERALEGERASRDALQSDLSALRGAAAAADAARSDLEQALDEARRADASQATAHESDRAALAVVERRCAELDATVRSSLARETEAAAEHQRIVTALDSARADLHSTSTRLDAATAQLAAIAAAADTSTAQARETAAQVATLTAQVEAERRRGNEAHAAVAAASQAAEDADDRRQDADERADAAVAERDELRRLLGAAKKSVEGMNAAVDEKLAAIDANRAGAVKAAEARADTALRERDMLAAELAFLKAAPPPVVDDGDNRERLEAATKRIRVLELQLFARERGPVDVDVDLGSQLPPAAPAPALEVVRARTPATRHGFKPPKRVRIDREGGLLVDLSMTGAQVICANPPEVGLVVTLTLLSDESPCFCQGRLLWARREQTAKGRPYRYPAGIAFTAVDDDALRAFIARHAGGEVV